ncbi:MAG: type II toxin-antitoxin system RelE/ParE family toxin [Phycisphaeraceae bacterium]
MLARLEHWPQVSGAKWLTGRWKDRARIRTGDYRVIFRVAGDTVWVQRVAHRSVAYDAD